MKNLHLVHVAIFTLVAIAHGLRLVTQADVLLGGIQIPVWASGVGLVVALALVWWNVRALHE